MIDWYCSIEWNLRLNFYLTLASKDLKGNIEYLFRINVFEARVINKRLLIRFLRFTWIKYIIIICTVFSVDPRLFCVTIFQYLMRMQSCFGIDTYQSYRFSEMYHPREGLLKPLDLTKAPLHYFELQITLNQFKTSSHSWN